MKYLISLFIVLFACTVAAAEKQSSVPVRFLGEWNTNLEHCGTGLNDSRMTISTDRVRFYESGGPIHAVVTQGEFELAIVVELSGEGETWLAYHHYRMSADHTYLTDVTGDSKLVRYRCPKS